MKIADVMEFESNFYAIVCEADTGIGAMELLVDKRTGTVGPESGPNMIWNDKYGMHGGGMMGGGSGSNTLPRRTCWRLHSVGSTQPDLESW